MFECQVRAGWGSQLCEPLKKAQGFLRHCQHLGFPETHLDPVQTRGAVLECWLEEVSCRGYAGIQALVPRTQLPLPHPGLWDPGRAGLRNRLTVSLPPSLCSDCPPGRPGVWHWDAPINPVTLM